MRGAVERSGAALDRVQVLAVVPGIRRGVEHAERHQKLAFGRELADGVIAVVGAENRAVRSYGDTVRAIRELAFPQERWKLPFWS